jgi:hypothetical protein
MEQNSGNKKILKFFIKLLLILIFIFYVYTTIQRVWFKDDKNVKQETCLNSKDYVGECKDGKRHGQGTLIYDETGRKYVGEWKDDKQHGQGTYTGPNGETYVGEFKNGLFHGRGTITRKDGKETIVTFKNGELVKEIDTINKK